MRRIALVNAMSNYDWVRVFTDTMRVAFLENDCECLVIDSARAIPGRAAREQLEAFGADMLFGFNAAGLNIRTDDGELLPSERFPYFNFMVDDPMFHQHWVPFLQHPHVYTGLCDPTHGLAADVIGISPANRAQVRLGGHPSPLACEEARTTDIIFTGAVSDPDSIREAWKKSMPATVLQITEIVAEIWGGQLRRNVHEIFESVVSELQIELSAEQRLALQVAVVANANRFVRNRDRLRILRELRDLPITVLGAGWDPKLIPGAKFRFGPSLSFAQSHEELCRSKILLNAQPIAIHAPGERALGGLVNGVALVTTENDYLSQHFVEGEEMISFSTGADDFSHVREALEGLLANPRRRREMAEAGREKALAGHTWAHRARDILHMTADAAAA